MPSLWKHKIRICLAFALTLLNLHCSSGEPVAVPNVGDTFCLDLDADTYPGYYTLDESDDPTSFAYVTCTASFDCDDQNKDVHFGAIEVTDNSLDDDCDGVNSISDSDATNAAAAAETTIPICADGTTAISYYRDVDGDGYGTDATTLAACTRPSGYTALNTDCNDANSDIHPGKNEIAADGVDQDCDGSDDTETCADTKAYFLDADGDGFRGEEFVWACEKPDGNYYTNITGDADYAESESICGASADENKYMHPGMSDKDYGYLVYQKNSDVARTVTASASRVKAAEVMGYTTDPTTHKGDTGTGYTTYEKLTTNELNLPEPADGEAVITNYFLDIDNDCDGDIDENSTTAYNKESGDADDPLADSIISNYNQSAGIYYNQCDGQGQFTYYTDADQDTFGDGRALDAECRKTSTTGFATNNTDCDDDDASVFPNSEKDYSNKNGITWGYSGIDNNCNNEVDEDKYLDETTTFDASVAWNGMSVKSENTTNRNTEHQEIGSFIGKMKVDDSSGNITYTGYTIYKHGVGIDDKFSYAIYHTPMKANRIFMQFYENGFYFESRGNDKGYLEGGPLKGVADNFQDIHCDSSNQCTGSFTVDLDQQDALENTFENGSEFLKGKKATIFLRGYAYEHFNPKFFADNAVGLSLDDYDFENESQVKVNYSINFNGTNIEDIAGKVYFTIAVYDPDYVAVGNFGDSNSNDSIFPTSEDSTTNMDKTAYASFSTPNLSDTVEDVSCGDTHCVGQTLTAGIVLRSWGFNGDMSFALYSLKASARPWDLMPGYGRFYANYQGVAWYDSDLNNSEYTLPNQLDARVISCANTSVCQFLHRESSGQEKQKSVDIDKEAF